MSKASTFTQGPWAVTRGGAGDPFSVDSATRTICTVKTCRGEADANARLIACAPELFSACEFGGDALLHNAGGIIIELSRGHENEETLRSIGEALRRKSEMELAAIRKAGGEA